MSAATYPINASEEEGASGPDGAWSNEDDPLAAAAFTDVGPGAEPWTAREGGARRTASDAEMAQWLEAIVDRDERALAALYDATVGRVFGLVRRIVRNDATAEEVVEDAYFQVWRQAVRFDPARGKALTWLLAIARSRALDALRREARFQHEPLAEDGASPVAIEAACVDELLDLARNRADLHQALTLLGAQPRQLVSMAFLRGLTHEEISEQTRLPLGTVKSQIRRALISLRHTLGRDGAPVLAS